MDVHDVIAAGGTHVLRVAPARCQCQESSSSRRWDTFLGERQHIVHAPNEFVFVRSAQFERTAKLEAEADVGARENAGTFCKPSS